MLVLLSLYFVFLNGQTPVTMPPSPPISYCSNIGGYDISSATNRPDVFVLPPPNNLSAFVSYSLCGTINSACGEAGSPCSGTAQGCCGMCQGWTESDGAQTVCLGMLLTCALLNREVSLLKPMS